MAGCVGSVLILKSQNLAYDIGLYADWKWKWPLSPQTPPTSSTTPDICESYLVINFCFKAPLKELDLLKMLWSTLPRLFKKIQ